MAKRHNRFRIATGKKRKKTHKEEWKGLDYSMGTEAQLHSMTPGSIAGVKTQDNVALVPWQSIPVLATPS